MSLSVRERAERIGTFRFVEVRLMELAAAWTPTTPELEVKVLLGRHIWDFAQHADALGRRTFELRQASQYSRRPQPAYLALLEDVARLAPGPQRLGALYDVLLPGLERRYAAYVAAADAILDAPSLVIVERIRADLARQRADCQVLRRELGLSAAEPGGLREREAALADILDPEPATA
jgi:hypothetical protein